MIILLTLFIIFVICLFTSILFDVIPFLFPSYLHKLFKQRLDGQHIWIIGGTRGIGRSIVYLCHQYGAVVSISSRSIQNILSTREIIGIKQGASIVYDTSQGSSAAKEAYYSVKQNAGSIDIIIFNAGINQEALPFISLSNQQITNIINTNISGMMYTFRTVLDDQNNQPKQNPHTLVSVSSLAAYRGVPGGSVYGATKAAVTAFCQSLAIELAGKINVVCVHPGFVDTPAIKDLQHPKPFVMSDLEAAKRILYATVTKRSHYGFPWIMENIVMKFSTLLPTSIYNIIMRIVDR